MQTNPPPAYGMQSPQGPVEPSTRERVARYKTLARRALTYWKVGLLLFVIGCGVAVAIAMNVKRTYRSECVILVKPGILVGNDNGESPEAHGAKQAAKLKEALTLRSKLEGAIKKFKLYPKTVDSKGLLDAVDEMRPHVGFRARDGGTYVVSFDSSEVDGLNTQDLVRDVTQYLSEQLIEEYATGNLGDLKMRADFLSKEQNKAEADLEKATQLLTVFLSQHPEFAMEAKQAAASNPFGLPPNPAMGIPLMPKQQADKNKPPVHQPTMDPALAALYGSDAQLGALYRQRARLEAELKNSTPATNTPVPVSTASVAALQEQVNGAQAEVEGAAKRAAETQADVMSKQQSLSPEHPDMKAAQANADLAARQLHQSKVKLATLQAQLRTAQNPGAAPKSDNPYETSNPDLVAKLKEIGQQIGQREAELKSKGAAALSTAPSAAPSPSGSASGTPAVAPPAPVSPLVALETEWQRLLRGLSEAKATQDGLRKEYEKAQMGVKAQQAAANDLMQVIEAAYRPTHPAKGGRTPVAMGGAAAALLLALLYMAGRVAFNDTLIDSADIEALNLIPVLGIVPKIHVSPSARDGEPAAPAKGGRVGAV